MLGRTLGIAAATTFVAAITAGIIALIASDFTDVGKQLDRFWDWYNSQPAQSNLLGKAEGLRDASDITFFTSVPIRGSKLSITTGISFATAEDLTAGKVKDRWCYIQAGKGKFTERLDLGSREGESTSAYTETSRFTAQQLSSFGLSAKRFETLARRHCLFDGLTPSSFGADKVSRLLQAPHQLRNLAQRELAQRLDKFGPDILERKPGFYRNSHADRRRFSVVSSIIT